MNSSAIGLFSLMSKHFLNTLDLFITNNDHLGTIAKETIRRFDGEKWRIFLIANFAFFSELSPFSLDKVHFQRCRLEEFG